MKKLTILIITLLLTSTYASNAVESDQNDQTQPVSIGGGASTNSDCNPYPDCAHENNVSLPDPESLLDQLIEQLLTTEKDKDGK